MHTASPRAPSTGAPLLPPCLHSGSSLTSCERSLKALPCDVNYHEVSPRAPSAGACPLPLLQCSMASLC